MRDFPLVTLALASVGIAREDERRAGHDGGTSADKRHVDILDLTRAGATRGLKGALDDVPQAVYAARSQAATKRVQRQFTIELDPTPLDEVEGFALFAETVGLKAINHGGREAVIDLGHVDIFRRKTGAFPGEFG